MTRNEQSVIRNILKNEITWVIFIVAGVMGFVQTVVIPLKEVQLKLAEIQTTISGYEARITKCSNDNIDQYGKLDALSGRLTTIEKNYEKK